MSGELEMRCERVRKLISRWHRDELGVERKARPHRFSILSAKVRGARFAEGGGRFTGMPRMMLCLRYLTLKLRALCLVLRRMGAGQRRLACAAELRRRGAPNLLGRPDQGLRLNRRLRRLVGPNPAIALNASGR